MVYSSRDTVDKLYGIGLNDYTFIIVGACESFLGKIKEDADCWLFYFSIELFLELRINMFGERFSY